MGIQSLLTKKIIQFVQGTYTVNLTEVEFQATRKDFEGDLTVVVFPMLRHIKGNPVQIGQQIGEHLVATLDEIIDFNVVKGFLNLVFSDRYFLDFFSLVSNFENYGFSAVQKPSFMVEYSSPNTNKPLHLGHIRNIVLGDAMSKILQANGHKVYKTQIINDRGIHICKSMLAWQRYGNGETPKSTNSKGDKFVGNYYVKFNQVYQQEIEALVAAGKSKEEAENEAPILLEAKEMLRNTNFSSSPSSVRSHQTEPSSLV